MRGNHHDVRHQPLSCDPKKLKGLSEKLIVSHWENNYSGAVRRLNAIATHSMILHELYFDDLGADGEADRALREALARDFGSVDRWRTEFVAMGKAMGGISWTNVARLHQAHAR